MIALAASALALAATLHLSVADSAGLKAPPRVPAHSEQPAQLFRAMPPLDDARIAGAPVVLLVNDSSQEPQVALAWKQPPGQLLALLRAVEGAPRETCFVEWKASRGVNGHETWWLDRERGLLVSRTPAAWRARTAHSASWSFRCPAVGVNGFTGDYALEGGTAVQSLDPEEQNEPGPNDYVAIDELPEAIKKVAPLYPPDAHVEGVVVVKARVEIDGSVGPCVMIKSIPELDAAAIASVKLWKFKPALAKGKRVAVWCAVPVRVERPQ